MPIGKIEPFLINSQKWPAYIRRVNQFIKLNEISEDLRVSMLITVVGEDTYGLMCDLCAPSFPESKTFDELVSLVTSHLEPQRSEIAERHVFRQRRQKSGESLTDYLQALKHLAVNCHFGKCGKCSTLEENLRDQFVSGLGSDGMRSRIFAEKKIQYKEAVELALALEAADRHAEVSGNTTAAATATNSSTAAGEDLHYGRGGGGGRAGQRGRLQRAPERGGGGGGSSGAEANNSRAVFCWRCGKAHMADRCRFKNFTCDECGYKGHLKVMCKKISGKGSRQTYISDEESDEAIFNIEIATQGNKPYFVRLMIDNVNVNCEVDTGSRISAINEEMYKRLFSHRKIVADNLILRSYSGSKIESLGYIEVDVGLGQIKGNSLHLYVIKGGARPLLGREWMRILKVTQITINEITDENLVTQLQKEFPEVFSDTLGTCRQRIRLQLTDSEPVYVRARPLPLALRARVERELERLEADGTIYRVDYSDYGTPIVPVVKANGEIRICGDYKVTINPKLKRDYYPLPRIEELFAKLSGGEKFSKIDLRHAYEQCFLSEESQPYTAITTHMGTYVYRRTPYGLSCIPEKFQKIMEETLHGVPGCVAFLDDICVTGSSKLEHIRNLRAVLDRLRRMGLTVNLSKCRFLQDSVKYVGFIINNEGLRPDPKKLEAISNVPSPKNISQLKSFLGMLNYYGRFIPRLSTILQPLHNLLKKEVRWNWDRRCEEIFDEAKKNLLSKRVLAHYEEGRELVLSVDSSAYGLGAVLAHRYEDGSERPVSCVSRTLSAPERNYSQLDKEALAILFGVMKHHQYLFGRRFTLRTDHQPLTHIFGEKGGIPQTAASRLQRWAARLAAYDFRIEFVRSVDNGPADALSRLPLPQEGFTADADTGTSNYLNIVEELLPVNYKDIAKETERDTLLSKIKGYILVGWPAVPNCEAEKPYFVRRQEFLLNQGCVMYKYRLVVPQSLQRKILGEIHEGHLGMNKMKNLARSYVYWASLDQDIEEVCRSCSACRSVLDAPPHVQLHPWEFPLHPWQRVHADFADCGGVRYFVIVDAHSKWIEAFPMKSTNAASTIKVLRCIFARFGLPAQLVTDNGPPFASLDFKNFCDKNFIKHSTSAPYRPQGNGAAENAVKTIKKVIKRALYENEDVNTALSKFLLQYRNCEHATTGVSPAVALQGRRLRSRLDALRPDIAATVRAKQERQVTRVSGADRSFNVGDSVLARSYAAGGDKWTTATVVKKTGPVSYVVNVGDGLEWRRHADQLISVNSHTNRYALARISSRLLDDSRGINDTDNDQVPLGSDSVVGTSAISQPLSPVPTSSPPVATTARALRALNRAKRQERDV